MPTELYWLWQKSRPLLHLHLSSFLCVTSGSALALLTPLMLKWLIDKVIPGRHAGLLLLAMALIFVGSEGRTAVTSLASYLTMTAAQRLSLNLRMELLRHLDSLSADYYDTTPIGEIVYPLREPIEEIAYFASDLVPAVLRTVLNTGFTLATMLALSTPLTLLMVPFIPTFLIVRQHFRKKLTANSDTAQQDRVAWSKFLEEHVPAAIPIQLLGQQKRQERTGFRLLGWAVRSQERLFRTGVWFTLYTSLAVVLAMSAVIGYGGWRVFAGDLSLGSLVAFYSFVMQFFDPLSGAAELYSRAQKTFASVRQVRRVLVIRSSVRDSPGACLMLPNAAAGVEFVQVEFGYERQKRMLRVPSLRIAPGERLAISGENGAGKSTLAKLIARLYDVDSGSVRIGGEDVRRIRLDVLRKHICYLPREPVLFGGSLASNLRFVNSSASEGELWAVVKNAGLAELVSNLPHGLQQRVGPGACQLSGGERQRLAIARALLQRPKILILDEATSCLDPCSEELVLRNVLRCLSEAIVIIISHRHSTPSSFVRQIVVSGGDVVSDGAPRTAFSGGAALAGSSQMPLTLG